jgi:hypothetical protein
VTTGTPARKIASLALAVTFVFTLFPESTRAFPINGEVLRTLMQAESAEKLFAEVSASLRGWKCSGANAEKLARARGLVKSAKAYLDRGKYGRAIRKLQNARAVASTISNTGPKVRHFRVFNSKTKFLIALCAVVITGSVMASRSEASEGDTRPRKMAEQTRDSIPSYFDLIESSGCSD